MLVLASASPRRRELLADTGLEFRIVAADVDETPAARVAPEDVAVDLARRKARTVAERLPGDVVLGADTLVVAATGEILGKPVDAADARRMLGLLSDSVQRVITGVCLVTPNGEVAEAVTTRVTMRALHQDEIAAYVASGESDGKAGAYAIQETGDRFVERVEGSWTNVVGLPMERVRELLADAGFEVGSTC